MRIETFLIAKGYHSILLVLFVDIEGKDLGLICSNIESIVIYLDTSYVLNLLELDLLQVLGKVQ